MVPFTYAVRPAGYDQLASLFWEQSKLTVMNGGIATINRVTLAYLVLDGLRRKKDHLDAGSLHKGLVGEGPRARLTL